MGCSSQQSTTEPVAFAPASRAGGCPATAAGASSAPRPHGLMRAVATQSHSADGTISLILLVPHSMIPISSLVPAAEIGDVLLRPSL